MALVRLGLTAPFVVFDNLDHGVRAAIKLLFNYIRWYDCHTIREIISRFAPASEK